MQTLNILNVIVRYTLGIIMMAYGLIKIFQIQFDLPSEVYDLLLREMDGVTITWAFLGFSPWFSMLLGVFEFVPAVLLLFRRTKLIGALLLFPMLMAIFLINLAYGFLIHMQLFTGILLLMDMVVIFFSRQALFGIFNKALQKAPRHQRIELIANILLITGAIVLIVLTIKL